MNEDNAPFSLSASVSARKSGLIALALTALLCLFGWSASMGLAHSGGPLLLLFAPVFPIFALFGRDGLFPHAPEWAFAFAAAIAEYIGVFVVVHGIRLALAAKSRDGA